MRPSLPWRLANRVWHRDCSIAASCEKHGCRSSDYEVQDDQRCRYRSYASVRFVDLVHKLANITGREHETKADDR